MINDQSIYMYIEFKSILIILKRKPRRLRKKKINLSKENICLYIFML